MKKFLFFALFSYLFANVAFAQNQQNLSQPFDLSDFGVKIQPDARLLIVELALDAAGFDSKQESVFRRQAQQDFKALDPDLRRRLREFYERNKIFIKNEKGERIEAPAGEQIARYVSMAYALGPVPDLSAPERSPDLPSGLLEVLDFSALVQEFYRKSGVADKLPDYQRTLQRAGDLLRPKTAIMVRDLTSFLNTRPQTIYLERTVVKSKSSTEKSKKPGLQNVEVRERARSFYLVPDLLAVPGSVKLRVIGDNYFATVAPDVVPSESSELRRAYLQFLIDALVFKNAKEIALQKDAIRSLLDDKANSGGKVSTDVYLAVARSFVVAVDANQAESKKIADATRAARERIDQAQTTPEKLTVSENLKKTRADIEKETFTTLSEAYEDGAVLSFFFAENLKGLESSGFDVTNTFTDMIASFDVAKEKARLKETEAARRQALTELAERRKRAATQTVEFVPESSVRALALVKNLSEVEEMVNLRDYDAAEKRLKDMLNEFPGEPRIFFALGSTAGRSASIALDETVRDERLEKAAAYYRGALAASNTDTPRALLSNTHVALGKIYEFYDKNDEALKEFEAAVIIGDVKDGAYRDAVAGKARLTKK